ncbi:MAG: hypothetical protein HY906_16220 [Deltaproteobacteria bacterium]|nr:hypothetical protein [Deltaproteobacteria bacterium]
MRDPRRLVPGIPVAALLVVALGAAACGPTSGGDDTGDAGGHDAAADGAVDGWSWPDGASPDAPVGFVGAVYAHSSSQLYKIDPDTLDVTLVAAFDWPAGSDQMTDIALDKDGNMVGISYGTVYSVNKDTAACTRLASLDRSFNGLSFVPADEVGTGVEILVGAALDGSVYRIDKTTGASSLIGNYGGGMSSSGDIVSVTGFGTVATVKQGLGTDWLVRVDANTGVATTIGDTGVADIWGLGFWKDKVYGFTDNYEFVLVDIHTGVAQLVKTGDVAWWGAGVTTSAPYIE